MDFGLVFIFFNNKFLCDDKIYELFYTNNYIFKNMFDKHPWYIYLVFYITKLIKLVYINWSNDQLDLIKTF